MPPKRSSGEPKQGLVITLVFFILATIGLGVATYFGFAEQDAKDKAKAAAEQKEKRMGEERDWYRFQWNLARAYMGQLPGGEAATEVGLKKIDFDKANAQSPSAGAPAAAWKDAVELRTNLERPDRLGAWNPAANRPARTYEELLAAERQRAERAETASRGFQQAQVAAEKRVQELETELREAKKSYDTKLAEQLKKATDDLAADRKKIEDQRAEILNLGKEVEKGRTAVVKAQQSQTLAEARQKKAQEDLRNKENQLKQAQEQQAETNAKLVALYEKSGVDPKALEAKVLDAKAAQALQNWQENWKIVALDRRGTMPYINLGSADHVTPQLTFSIHGVGQNGRPLATVKGTLEVVKVIGEHLSQARVTSATDPDRDPILKGDLLFNPSWHPTLKKHIALVGLIDLAGDGRDSLPEMMRNLERQNVVVDAWMDPKDGTMKGKGISSQTDYLVVGGGSDTLTGPRSRDNKYTKQVDDEIKKAKEKAAASGVAIVNLRKYLELIGYRVPHSLAEGSTAPAKPYVPPYTPRGNR